jgi:hypothetical protein
MGAVADLFAAHPFWVWMALGALLLAVEAGTGSGWLLWPAASAGLVGLLVLTGLLQGGTAEIGVFAVLTLVSTFLARRYLAHAPVDGPDINDQRSRLTGQTGEVSHAMAGGHGRVFVGGAEWPAELDGGGDLAPGARVVVTGVAGRKLTVKAV